MTTPPADGGIATVRQPVNADEVRAELAEFEAAVRKAEQDSAQTQQDSAHAQQDGALAQTDPAPSLDEESRKEPGSDNVDG
jgi:hypothetical protein